MHLLLQAISGSKELTSIIFNLRCHNRNHCPQINCTAPPGIPAASGWGSAHSAPALSGLALLSASCRKYYLHLDRPSLRFEASQYWTGAGTTIGKRVSLQGTCTISFLQILCACLDFSAGFLQSLCIESFRKSSVHACQGPGCARIHPSQEFMVWDRKSWSGGPWVNLSIFHQVTHSCLLTENRGLSWGSHLQNELYI